MRTRSRGTSASDSDGTIRVELINSNPTAETYNGLTVNANSTRTFSYEYSPRWRSDKSVITDSVGPNTKAYRPCLHNKEDAGWPSEARREYNVSSSNGKPLLVRILNQGFSRAISYASDPGSATQAAVESINLTSPRRRFDAGRFIGELTEFTEGVHHLATLWDLFERLFGDTKRDGSVARLLMRELSRDYKYRKLWNLLTELGFGAINADLAYKFFIKPFVADMKDIWGSVTGLDKLVAELIKPKPFVMRGIASRTSYFRNEPANSVAYLREFHTRRKTSVAWVLAKYRTPDAGLLAQRLRYMLGFDAIRPSIAWELFPRSFVVDWFVGIGRWLRDLESFSRAHTWEYDVLMKGLSIKETNEWLCTAIAGEGYTLAGKLPLTVTVETRSVKSTYNRDIGVFDVDNPGSVFPQLRIPSNDKLFTLIEMIVSGQAGKARLSTK